MDTGSMILDSGYNVLFSALPVILALMGFLCLIRAIRGPRIADRIVAINMLGTLVMVIISILAVRMNEGYLVDICIIYAMISFLAVTLLTKVYMGVYAEKKAAHPSNKTGRTTQEKQPDVRGNRKKGGKSKP